MQDVRAHHEIAVEEVGRERLVGAEAAHVTGQVEHDVGGMLLKQPYCALLGHQVVIAATYDEHPVATALAQLFDDVASQKASTAGDHDPLALQRLHRSSRNP